MDGTRISTLKGMALAWILLSGVAAAQSITKVDCYERTRFHAFKVEAVNPFRDIKIKAIFVHRSSALRFEMPVVAYGGEANGQLAGVQEWEFEAWFTPNIIGVWDWWLETVGASNGAAASFGQGPVLARPASFECHSSKRRGWWRPDIASSGPQLDPPGLHPHALVEPNGSGAQSPDGWRYVRPAQTTLFTLTNRGWPRSEGRDALDWAVQARIGRVRFALSTVLERRATNTPTTGPQASGQRLPINHTIFRQRNPAGNFSPANLDFEAFDLGQWAATELVVEEVARRGMTSSVIVCMNFDEFDFEEHYAQDFSITGSYAPIPVSVASPFADRAELYLWYVVGRLGSHPSVHYSLMHEWDGGAPGTSPLGRRPVTLEVVRGFGRVLARTDPYLAHDANTKIVIEVTKRGSFYLSGGGGGCSRTNASGTNDQRLSTHVRGVLQPVDDDWRSVVGMQRGGEFGITSIESPVAGVPGTREPQRLSFPCATGAPEIAHRPLMRSYGNVRPILIEEDWIARNDVANPNDLAEQPGISLSFISADNPYAVFVGRYQCSPRGPTGGWRNQNAFAFLSNNFEGLRKGIRDAAWMAGVICQGHTCYWTRKYTVLDASIATQSWSPYAVIDRVWNRAQRWWEFRFDANLVTAQDPIAPLAGLAPTPTAIAIFGSTVTPPTFGLGGRDWSAEAMSCPNALPPVLLASTVAANPAPRGRVPFEQMVIGAKRPGGDDELPSFVFYCPVGSLTGPAQFRADLAGIPAGHPFTYFFVDPDHGKVSPLQGGQLAAGSTEFTFPRPPVDYTGEFHEYVVFVNCPLPQ